MPQCCVPRCFNRSETKKTTEVSFYRFPCDDNEKRKWLQLIRRENFTPNCNSRVCSWHFPNGKAAGPSRFAWNEGTTIPGHLSHTLRKKKPMVPLPTSDPFLPVSSLRLLVPPLQLFSAAMWQVVQQQRMLYYGKLEEFVSLVMEVFPELLSESQRAELTLGLQHMGPAEIGCKTDPAVETLLWEFLSRLDQQLLVPDLKQTVSWLHAAPSVLEVYVQSDSCIDQLRTLLRPHRSCQQLDKNETCPSLEECKLDYMGLPPSQRVVDSTIEERTERKTGYLINKMQKNILTNMKEEEEDGESQSLNIMREDDESYKAGYKKEEEKQTDKQMEGNATCQTTQTGKLVQNRVNSELIQNRDNKEVTFCLLKKPEVLHQHPTPPKALPTPAQSHPGTPGAHPCSQCGTSFIKARNLKRHLQTHTGERPYSCSQCGKSFTRFNTLKSHLLTHTGERPYPCSQCGKSFTRLSSLTLHQRIHTGERPYPCSQCEKSFANLNNFKKHLRTHTGERPYFCSECGRSFALVCTLTRHQRTHTGERPYPCSECGKSFTNLCNLKLHLRTHTGERPYPCAQCGKSFALLRTLRRHQLTHTGERPYPCSQCGKSFALLRNLRRHQLTHTGERP